MNILQGIWDKAAVATETGWFSATGELLVASKNLLTERVKLGYATPEESKRWSTEALLRNEAELKRLESITETNVTRLTEIQEAFAKENKDLIELAKTSANDKVTLAYKQLDLAVLEAQYEKANELVIKKLAEVTAYIETIKSYKIKSSPKVKVEEIKKEELVEEVKEEKKTTKKKAK